MLAIDAERQLDLFVEQDAHFDSLFLHETVQNKSTPCEDSQQDRCGSLLGFNSRNVKGKRERIITALRLSISSKRQ